MARRRRTGTTRQREDCLAAERSVSGLKTFCAAPWIEVVAIFGGEEGASCFGVYGTGF